MKDRAQETADAVAAALAAATFSEPISPAVEYVPEWTLKAISEALQVSVVGRALTAEAIDRNYLRKSVEIDVAVAGKLPKDSPNTRAGELGQLMSEIRGALELARLETANHGRAQNTGWKAVALYDWQRMRKHGVFLTVTRFTFTVSG